MKTRKSAYLSFIRYAQNVVCSSSKHVIFAYWPRMMNIMTMP